MLRLSRRFKYPVIAGIVLLAGGLALIAVGAGFCAATLHVPRSVTPAPPNAATVEIAAPDNAKLSGWWLRPAKQNGNCVIVLHGIGGSRASSIAFAPMFLDRGYAVLLPDSRATGASGGEFVTYGLLERFDVIAWAHWLKTAGCRKIYGLGESLGASILIQAAATEPSFAAVVAECPFADLRETAEYRVRRKLRLPAFIGSPLAKLVVSCGLLYANLADSLDFRQVSPVNSIQHSSTPILLIHGLNDSRTPPSNSQMLAAANPSDPLWLVPKASHTAASSTEPDQFRRRVLSWFEAH
jgi:dipeptidyl aminopeptidase/acylaminoacyl peptidase